MKREPALRLENLRARYPGAASNFELVVDSLEIHSGEALAILGPNGAGKSTLLRVMAGLTPPAEGRVLGVPSSQVAMVFQRPVMLRGSVAYNVQVPLWSSRLARTERARRVAAGLSRFGVEDLADREASTLSGGEMRRVALAQALVREPNVLLLDEPFDDLDAPGQESLSLDLRKAVRDTRIALVLVTHDLRHALLLADRVAVLVNGHVVQCDRREEVLRRPCSATVARLVGMSNVFPARTAGRDENGDQILEVSLHHRLKSRSPLPPESQKSGPGEPREVLVGIRPERVKLDVGRGDTPLIGKGVVRQVVSDGTLVTLQVEWANLELRTVLIADRGLGHRVRVGDAVSLAIRPEDVHLLGVEEPPASPRGR